MVITAIKMMQEMNDQPLVIEPLGVRDVGTILEREVVLLKRYTRSVMVSAYLSTL